MILGLCSDNLSGIMLLTFGPNWANIQIIMPKKQEAQLLLSHDERYDKITESSRSANLN